MKHINEITITKPSDMHLHLRDGEFMQNVVNFTAAQMDYALIMPNLSPPVTTTQQALEYKQRILDASKYPNFKPLMTLYLTETIDPSEVKKAKDNGIVGFKLYPAGATTNSENGVKTIENIYPVFAEMEKEGMLLLIHGEVVDKEVDVFDRERVFIDTKLKQIIHDFPQLKIVFEHITTADAVDFVLKSGDNIAATITPQHLINNRNDMLVGGIKPHYYCLPILKAEKHRQALVNAAISGDPKFFLGTDSAPHFKDDKESACGCAGCFSSPFAIEFYAEIFDENNALDKLENFASVFGPRFYNVPQTEEKITLLRLNSREKTKVDSQYEIAGKSLVPYGFGTEISWKLLS
jgi:dihydroorotase